jgi:hypothetical protein
MKKEIVTDENGYFTAELQEDTIYEFTILRNNIESEIIIRESQNGKVYSKFKRVTPQIPNIKIGKIK